MPTAPDFVERADLVPGVGIPDYLVMDDGGRPRAVLEVKLGVRTGRDGSWTGSPELEQVIRYASALDLPAVLVDSARILLIPRQAEVPYSVIMRRAATRKDLDEIGRHLMS